MRNHTHNRLAGMAALLLASSLAAPVRAQTAPPAFAGIFSDHAVLQRDEPLSVWGTAAPGLRVTVRLGSASAEASADANGRWRATMPAMAAGGPHTLSVTGGGGVTTLKDIMIGDVYLCGGQSNMAFPARLSTGAWPDFPANPNLRFINIQLASEPAVQDDLKRPVEWRVVTPTTAGEASAVCYYMARTLQQTQKVPVGFIGSTWGGTTIQGWIGASSLKTLPAYTKRLEALADMASNPAKAMADEARRHEQWWDAHDPRAHAQRAWRFPEFDDSGWPDLTPRGSWKDAGIAALADFDGAAWFRTSLTLNEAQARAANAIQLGPVDTYDSTWVNGVRVGGGSTAWVWRDYAVPAGVFKTGRNVIAIRVLGGGTGGGLTGLPEQRGVKTADGQFIALSAPWKYQLGMRSKGLSIPPAPWDIPTSLSTLHNAMIAPLAGYKFKLAAWYQGESNTDAAKEYETLLPLLIADWRETFAQPELPFLVAQLSSFGSVATKPGLSNWAQLREAQARTVRNDRHAGLAVTIDVGDRTDVHPPQKAVVGERLARAARALAYGEAIAPGGPEAAGVTRSGEDLVVKFKNTGGGLRTYSAGHAIGFEACAGAACEYALAVAQGDTVTLKGANLPGRTHVRYAWADAPYVNLYGGDDLPAAPFMMEVEQAGQ
ncbi:sialate O-acetylesterase [Pseudoduganella namucuonensis]|uniref:Sialate O-acetylesterase n=1 Tax=Pseudoduganella namucuonensis TaxID=1035707 RepID=A0A1I7M2Q1_9BURK|nr:sialate O-acetylesterase [Pseudoduganella namucuonensis]SFV16216.1 sialate O-acetylesterase [Pseudoduganella namucuonensis]